MCVAPLARFLFGILTAGMKRKKFKFSHSVLGLVALLLVQGVCMHLFPKEVAAWLLVCFSALGAGVIVYVATEIIEEVHSAMHMLRLLFATVVEFVAFFAFEYLHLLLIYPASFPTLSIEPISLTLHSLMVFVFNPLYLPANLFGGALLFINTASAVLLVLFILQNVGQLRKPPAAPKRPATRKKKVE